jgi:hypothetical protein
MRRFSSFLFGSALAGPIMLALAWALASSSCATYRQDLERAKTHYEGNQYEAALALFRVLEPDMDSFSDAERTQYAYLRGMTDYRLASLANAGTNVADPKKGFRDNARHWLSIASAIDKKTPGGITEDEKLRLTEAMTDLNHDVYGGADSIDADGGAPEGGAVKAKDVAADKPADKPTEPAKKP